MVLSRPSGIGSKSGGGITGTTGNGTNAMGAIGAAAVVGRAVGTSMLTCRRGRWCGLDGRPTVASSKVTSLLVISFRVCGSYKRW